MSTWSFQILSVAPHDGDTVKVVADLGFGVSFTACLRLEGIDAPELADKRQEKAAKVCLAAVAKWFADIEQRYLVLRVTRADKFGGRWLGDFHRCDDEHPTLAGHLLKHGYARPYKGDAKQPWTDAELHAIERKGAHHDRAAVGGGEDAAAE